MGYAPLRCSCCIVLHTALDLVTSYFVFSPKQLLCKVDVYKDTYLGLSYRQTVNVTSTEETSTEKRTKSVSKSAAPPCRITSLSIH